MVERSFPEHAQALLIESGEGDRSAPNSASRQETITHIAEIALTETNIPGLLLSISSLLAGALAADLCLIYELDPEQDGLVLRAHSGHPEDLVPPDLVPRDNRSLPGYSLLTDQGVRSANLGADKRFTDAWLSEPLKVSSGASALIPGSDHPWGVICVYNQHLRNFKPTQTGLLESAARILSSAIERLWVEEALHLARDQFAHIVEGVAEAITVQKTNGQLVYANLAAAQLLGYSSAQELIATPVQQITQNFAIFGEDGREFPLEKLPGRLALQGVPDASATLRFQIHASGEERWSIVSAKPVFDANGQVALAVNIFRDISDLKRRELYQKLLAEAGAVLSASIDYSATLANVAQLAVTNLADWCIVHILEEDETVKQLVVAHMDPQKVDMALALQQKYPPNYEAPTGVGNVLRTGQAEYYPHITDEMVEAGARDEEHRQLLKELGLKSVIITPLIARGKTLGAISLIWAESGRHYTQDDVQLVEELGQRMAIAIDNARLYRHSQRLNEELERRVTRRTARLQDMVAKLRSEIGERQRVEQDLRQTESLLTNLFESAPDAVILVDTEGRIVRMNQQGEKLFGYRRGELQGKSVDVLLPTHLRSRHQNLRSVYFHDMQLRPMGVDIELKARRKDGSEIPVEIMLSPVHTEEGSFVISAVRDITERKKLQAELAEVHRMLLENIEAERLHLSRELHDGPIQDLYSLSLEMIHLGKLSQSKELTAQLETAVKNVKEVVADLRNMCGELRPPALTPFGLEKSIRAHVEALTDKDPDLRVNLDLMSDQQELPERIRLALFRVYQNAISNARRHGQASQVDVKFYFDQEQVTLEVQDNGLGFTPPKKWVDLARQGHFGLVGSAERVEAIGGHLELVTAPGEGTLIRATIPLRQEVEPSMVTNSPVGGGGND